MTFDAGSLNRRIRIEQPIDDESLDGAGSGSWALVKEVSANIQDALPSRGERLADGINAAARPARVRIRYRRDVNSSMRIDIGRYERNEADETVWMSERIAQIITQPAELGFRDGLEFMVEDYSPAGGSA